MSILRLILKKGYKIGTIEIDAFLAETSNATAKVTKNPVENGADINDHVIIEPMTFTVNGVVSNTSSSSINQFGGAASTGSSGQTKAQQIWSDLLKLQASREPFTLTLGLKAYDNVIIQSLSADQDKSTANALFFTASFSEIILVGTQAPPAVTYADSNTSDKSSPATGGGRKQVVA